jgi:alpha-aminoadipate carrier protein LysW
VLSAIIGAHGLRRWEREVTMPRGFCPDCDAMITVGREVRVGTRLDCPQCGVELEVLSLSPFELDYADFEDWEGDEEEGDEEWEDEE